MVKLSYTLRILMIGLLVLGLLRSEQMVWALPVVGVLILADIALRITHRRRLKEGKSDKSI
jgi:cytochrome c-type biogenesis protein CcmH/NrfF